MIDGMRSRLGARAARRAAQQRTSRPLAATLTERRLLVVLPHQDEDRQLAWQFLRDLALSPRHITPILYAGEGLTDTPDAFAAREVRLESEVLGWNGLPKNSFVQALWASAPDIALSLRIQDALVAQYLVGASPAAFRIGFHDAGAEDFFDLLLQHRGDFAESLATLRHTLAHIQPSLLPL